MPRRRSVCAPVAKQIERHVGAHLHVPEEPKPGAPRHLVERSGHALDLLVVGRDAEPDEPERGRQTLEHVHGHAAIGPAQQRLCGKEPGGTGSDDGDAKRHGSRHDDDSRCGNTRRDVSLKIGHRTGRRKARSYRPGHRARTFPLP
jgi:hypothetical protein